MTLKNWLHGSAAALGILAVAPLAQAEQATRSVATTATSSAKAESHQAQAATAPSYRGSQSRESLPPLSTKAAEFKVVREAVISHSWKHSEAKGGASAAFASGGSSLGSRSELPPSSTKAAELKVVREAVVSHSWKRSDGMSAASVGHSGAAADASSSMSAIGTAARRTQIVAQAARAHAEKNNAGKPANETPRREVSGFSGGSAGGGAFHSMQRGPTAFGAMHRMMPMERATHCHGHGECF